jgi:hypothetical protein
MTAKRVAGMGGPASTDGGGVLEPCPEGLFAGELPDCGGVGLRCSLPALPPLPVLPPLPPRSSSERAPQPTARQSPASSVGNTLDAKAVRPWRRCIAADDRNISAGALSRNGAAELAARYD